MLAGIISVVFAAFAGLAVAQEAASPPPPQAAILYEVRIGELVDQLRVPVGRTEARKQLTAIGSDATPQLIEHLKDADPHFRWEIVSLLGAIADARAAGPVAERAVRDDNAHVRWRACLALSAAGDAAVLPRLKAVAEADPAERVRKQAQKSIDKIERRTASGS